MALFKASLTKETRIKTKKNNDSVEFVLKNVFVPLLDKLILKLESLNELFFENRIDIIIDGKHNSEPLSKADFHLKILNETNRPETLRDLEFIYTFSGYVKPAKHVFDTNFRLKLTFNQFEYLIYLTNDQKKIIAKAYGEILTNVEVEDIIKRGIKDLIETIKDYSE